MKLAVPKNIIITRFDGLGDFVIALSGIKAIRDEFVMSKLILICNNTIKQLAMILGWFDAVISVDLDLVCMSEDKKVTLIEQTKKYSDGLLIQMIYSRTYNQMVLDDILPISKKIAIKGDGSNCRENDLVYENEVYDELLSTTEVTISEFERNHLFICKLLHRKYNRLFYQFDKERFLRSIDEPYYVFVLGTSLSIKNWPIIRFVETYNEIKKYHQKCVLIGTNKEEEYGKRFMRLVGDYTNIINLVGKTDMDGYFRTIAGSEFVLSGDTSAAHIAAALCVPCICITGGWQWDRFFPYPLGMCLAPPVVCKKSLDCYGCNGKYTDDCWESIKRHDCMKCLFEVESQSVIKEIELIVEEK